MWNTTTIMQWVSDNAGAVSLASVVTLCVLVIAGAVAYDRRASIAAYREHRRSIRIQRGLVMGRKKNAERQAYVKGLFGDVITSGLEEAWFAGKITREEANALYRAIGKTHNMRDLLPVMTPEVVKSAIKGRRARGANTPAQEHPAWGDTPAIPVKPPVSPTANDTTNVVQAAKRFGQKFMDKVKKSA